MPNKCRAVGLEVVHVHRVANDVVAELVRFAVRDAGLDAGAGHPDREASRMVVPAVVRLVGAHALRIAAAPELAAPDHEGVVEHAAPLQVEHEGGGRLVDVLRELRNLGGHVKVVVPTLVVKLHEPHPALEQLAGQQGVGRVAARLARRLAVERERGFGFVGDVERLGYRGLHPVGHLVLGDPRMQALVLRVIVLAFVQSVQVVEHATAVGRRHCRRDC